ncbi:DNA repair protein RecO [Rothia sp. P7181]|uniref:DNA repair protein RecO n=1 Tax=Rothia sp. P7181 TaxID=3402663 RepID=UPI003AE59B2D
MVVVSTVSSTSRSYTDQALVLRTQVLGESDRIIILLTRSHGVVHAVARGVRKGRSAFGGRLEPFMYVDVSLRSGKNLSTVTQVQTRRAYTGAIMGNYSSYIVASVLSEVAEALTSFEGEGVESHFLLLAGALSALAQERLRPYDVLNSYVLRALGYAGWGFSLDSCAICDGCGGPWRFSPEYGAVCKVCSRSIVHSKVFVMPEDVRQYLMFVSRSQWDKLAQLDTELLSYAAFSFVSGYVQWHLEKPLKSFSLLKKDI